MHSKISFPIVTVVLLLSACGQPDTKKENEPGDNIIPTLNLHSPLDDSITWLYDSIRKYSKGDLALIAKEIYYNFKLAASNTDSVINELHVLDPFSLDSTLTKKFFSSNQKDSALISNISHVFYSCKNKISDPSHSKKIDRLEGYFVGKTWKLYFLFEPFRAKTSDTIAALKLIKQNMAKAVQISLYRLLNG